MRARISRSARTRSSALPIAKRRGMGRCYGLRLSFWPGAGLADVLGGYFVSSFLAYKRNEIERFERFVTDWEFREYAYHL
jgi:hypothetical protein